MDACIIHLTLHECMKQVLVYFDTKTFFHLEVIKNNVLSKAFLGWKLGEYWDIGSGVSSDMSCLSMGESHNVTAFDKS